jgi:hypothetical protein
VNGFSEKRLGSIKGEYGFDLEELRVVARLRAWVLMPSISTR